MNKDRQTDMREIATRLANTSDGMALIKYLREDYLLKSPFDTDNVYKTHVNIGIQTVIQKVLKLIENREQFDRVVIINKQYKQ